MMTLRKVLFVLFVLLFAGLCPWLIGHTLKIFRAGLAVVETIPQSSSLILNGKEVAQNTPHTLPDLQAGTYLLQVQKEKYQDYEQSLFIEKGAATVLDQILLIPDETHLLKRGRNPYDTFIPLAGTCYGLLMTAAENAKAEVYCSKNNQFTPLFPPSLSESSLKFVRIYTVPESPLVYIKALQNRETLFLKVSLEEEGNTVEDITHLIPPDCEEILWTADQPEWIFTFSHEEIDVINMQRKTKWQKFGNDWVGLGLGEEKVYGVTEEGRFFLKDYMGKMLETEATDFNFKKSIFAKKKFVRIYPLASGTILFHEFEGSLWQSDLPNLLSDQSIKGLNISRDTGDVLIWTDDALGIRKAVAMPEQGKIFSEGLKIDWLVEGNSGIINPTFIQKGTHALFAQGDKILLMDLQQLHLSPREVMRILPGASFHYVEASGEIFSLAPETGQLISFPLLPEEHHRPKGKSLGIHLKGIF